MSLLYDFALGFTNKEKRDRFKIVFHPTEIELSDNSSVLLRYYNDAYPNNNGWFIGVGIEGMEIPRINEKLFETPYYYEIRNFFYRHLLNIGEDFDYAFLGYEAADMFGTWDIRDDLFGFRAYYLGDAPPVNGDSTAQYMSALKPENYYAPCAWYDGLVVSEEIYQLTGKLPAFVPFKPGYYWKPIGQVKNDLI